MGLRTRRYEQRRRVIRRAAALAAVQATVLSRAVAYWRASQYKGFGPLLDESGNDHHLKLGSGGEVFMTGSCCTFWGLNTHFVVSPSSACPVTGDIHIAVDLAMDNWAPPGESGIIGKFNNTAASTSFLLFISNTGQWRFYFSNGASLVNGVVNPSVLAPGERALVEVVWRKVDGRLQFFRTVEGGVRTQIGADQNVGAGFTLHSPTTEMRLGGWGAAGATSLNAPLSGRIYSAKVYASLTEDNLVYNANFDEQPWGQLHFTESGSGSPVALRPGGCLVAGDALHLAGQGSNWCAVSPEGLDITGDIDIRVKVSLYDWTPTANSVLLGKYGAAGQKSYVLSVNTAGGLNLVLSFDGSADVVYSSTAALSFVDGATGWIRVVRSGANILFYTSLDGTTWTQLGTTVAGAATAIFVSTRYIELGSVVGGTASLLNGRIFNAQIFASANETSKVLDVSFTQEGNDNFVCSTGQVVRTYTTMGTDTNDPVFLRYVGTSYMWLPGIASNNASVPDESALDITGDIDIRVRLAPDSWTPSSTFGIISKYGSTQRTFYLALTNTGTLRLALVFDGTTPTLYDSNASLTTVFITGEVGWVRAVRSGANIMFYTSKDYNGTTGTWTQLGTTVAGVATALYSGISAIEVGTIASASALPGRFYRAQLFASSTGINKVLDINFDSVTYNSTKTTLTALTGQTVSINRLGTGRKSVIVDRSMFSMVTDDYMETPDRDDLDFDADDNFTLLTSFRYGGTIVTGVFIAKKVSTLAADGGWEMHIGASGGVSPIVSDGTDRALLTTLSPAFVAGVDNLAAATWNGTTKTLNGFSNGVAGTPETNAAVGSLATANVVRIGRFSGAGTLYADMLFTGAAIIHEELSIADQLTAGEELLV